MEKFAPVIAARSVTGASDVFGDHRSEFSPSIQRASRSLPWQRVLAFGASGRSKKNVLVFFAEYANARQKEDIAKVLRAISSFCRALVSGWSSGQQ